MVYHRPLSGIYSDNYRYGTAMYSSPGVSDIEKNYRNTLSKTHVRSDRGDLGLYSFAGSNVHGGIPAAERPLAPKGVRYSGVPASSGPDLYAPVNSCDYRPRTPNADIYAPLNAADYGPGYYDHLRARSPERRPRAPPQYYDLGGDGGYKTLPTKVTGDVDFDIDSGKKTTTTTTTTERWVPLTTHIYHTPYHSYFYKSTPFSSYTYRTTDDMYNYNYLDDYKRTTTTTKRSKNIDALDLSVTSKMTSDYSHHVEKCHEIQKQLEEVNKLVYEAEMKLKNDIVSSRSKMQSELAEVSMVVEDAAKYNDDLYRVIKKQAKQISSLNSKYDDIGRQMTDVSDVLEKSRMRSLQLQSELSSVQSGLELAIKRRY